MSKRYGKAIGVLSVWIAMVAAVVAVICYAREERRFKVPPPGYAIVTDGKGCYGAQMPGGHVIERSFAGGKMLTWQAAVNRAWAQWESEYTRVMEDARSYHTEHKLWSLVEGVPK